MKIWKIPAIATDAITAGHYIYVDVDTLQDVTTAAATTVITGLGWTLTATFDGSTAQKLANTALFADYIMAKILPYKTFPGNRGNAAESVFNLWAGLDYAGIIADIGIPTADGFVTFALS
mgnify:FL=1|tara:strand:- start:32 stop:391 length:360 start_codon:yes stop_codon:yes gene_type:complete